MPNIKYMENGTINRLLKIWIIYWLGVMRDVMITRYRYKYTYFMVYLYHSLGTTKITFNKIYFHIENYYYLYYRHIFCYEYYI